MKKYLIPLALLLFTGLTFYACTKSDIKEADGVAQDGSDLSLRQARSFFSQEVTRTDPRSVPATAPTSLFNSPLWNDAEYLKGRNGIGYWKVPLASAQKIQRQLTLSLDSATTHVVKLPSPSMLIYRDSSANLRLLVMQEIPYSMDNTQKPAAFSGDVRMYDWAGRFECGFSYANGKKIKQAVPSTSRYSRRGNPNARWEFVCTEYTDCEFQSTCAGSGSTGYESIVAYAMTRNESGCSYPIDDPYASAYSYNPGLSWSCSGWTQTTTHITTECDYVWIDDIPDPEPEPEYWSDEETQQIEYLETLGTDCSSLTFTATTGLWQEAGLSAIRLKWVWSGTAHPGMAIIREPQVPAVIFGMPRQYSNGTVVTPGMAAVRAAEAVDAARSIIYRKYRDYPTMPADAIVVQDFIDQIHAYMVTKGGTAGRTGSGSPLIVTRPESRSFFNSRDCD